MLDLDKEEKRQRLARRLFSAVVAEQFDLPCADDLYLTIKDRSMGAAWLSLADDVVHWRESIVPCTSETKKETVSEILSEITEHVS